MKRILRSLAPLLATVTFSVQAEINMPDIELQTLGGESILLSDTGGKFRVVNFWATWCPPCVKEMPALANLDTQLEKIGGDVIAIDVGEEQDQVEAFILENLEPAGLTLLLDPEGKSFPVFELSALPMTVVVSANNEILDYAMGGREWDSPEMVSAIKGLATAD